MSDVAGEGPRATPSLLRCLRRAFDLAAAEKHAAVTEAHVVAALLEDADVEAAVRTCGADPVELRDVALGSVGDVRRRPWYRRHPKVHGHVTDALRAAATHAMAAGLVDLGPRFLMVQILSPKTPSLLVERLEAMGLELLALKHVVSHGSPPPARIDRPAARRCDVVVHNDPFTTMEFVVEVLRSHFEMSEETASRLMREIHERGTSTVSTLEPSAAAEKAEAVVKEARCLGFPLLLTLEPTRSRDV
jgi:ATP-dependent Clp protease adaptor protein ClpS